MITIIWLVLLITGLTYAVLIVFCMVQWLRMHEFVPNPAQDHGSFSILIPARNEQENIRTCLHAITRQQYPAGEFEIIVIDDHSTDNTSGAVLQFKEENPDILVRLLRMDEIAHVAPAPYKKRAIEEGIKISFCEWIVTTDADCVTDPEWLSSLNAFIQQEQPKLVSSPVCLTYGRNLFQQMQALEFAGLVGMSGASMHGGFPTTCNGANLAYRKDTFHQAGGFADINKINSGDDEMLMLKMHRRWPKDVRFLKSRQATVRTPALETLQAFLQQRKRWVSKSTAHANPLHVLLLLLVYLFHAALIASLIAGFWELEFLSAAAAGFLLKTAVELPFLYMVCSFFRFPGLVRIYPIALLPQTFYVFFIGIYGNFGAYNWKGRKLR